MSFEFRGVLSERWREILRFAQDSTNQRLRNNQAVDAQQFVTAEPETQIRNLKPSLTRSF
jgi:hypothetical protein